MNAYHEAVAAIYDACEFAAAPISLAAALEEMSARGERVALDPDLLIALFEVHLEAIACPATSSSAWTGDGLPPVGQICQAQPHNAQWGFGSTEPRIVRIAAYFADNVWCIEECGRHTVSRTDKVTFSRIRTPEQIAEEERNAAIVEIGRLFHEGGPAAIYFAGYRKQEAV